jgi:hypothetical protein
MARKGGMTKRVKHAKSHPMMPPNTLSKGPTQGRYEARNKRKREGRLTGKPM